MSAAPAQKKVVVRLVALVSFMLAASFAAVPLYDWFCRVTGYGGTPLSADAGSEVILDQTITVRFDASLADDMAWEFKPEVRETEIRIGETGLAFYTAHNPTDKPIAGQASFNVFPYSAGGYFIKVQCFCFEMQVLQPGESVLMPVSFYVDPEIVDDADAKFAQRITLSYTFYETDLPDEDLASLN